MYSSTDFNVLLLAAVVASEAVPGPELKLGVFVPPLRRKVGGALLNCSLTWRFGEGQAQGSTRGHLQRRSNCCKRE